MLVQVYQARLGDELVAVKVFELQKDIREKVEVHTADRSCA